jgi:hypothetical protein
MRSTSPRPLTLGELRFWSGVNWRPSEMGFQSRAPVGFDLESKLQVRAVFAKGRARYGSPDGFLQRG